MNRKLLNNKETSTHFTSFYNPHHHDTTPFTFKKFIINNNIDIIENLSIQVEAKMDHLRQKIILDESKIQKNYTDLQQFSREIQESCQHIVTDKELEIMIKNKKEIIKNSLSQRKIKIDIISNKTFQEITTLKDSTENKERQVQKQKDIRENEFMKIIDEFEVKMVQLQKQLKQIRMNEQEIFEKIQVDIYNLDQNWNRQLEQESINRKKQHQTIIKLVGECIEKFRLIY